MVVSFGLSAPINAQDFNFTRVLPTCPNCAPKGLLDFARLDFNRLGSLAGGLLLFLLLSVVRLNSSVITNKSTSIEGLSAGDRSNSLLINSLVLLMVASTSIDSIFTQCTYVLNDRGIIARVFGAVLFAL
jgi:hypothetical protein